MYTGFSIALVFLDLSLLFVLYATDWDEISKALISEHDQNINRYIATTVVGSVGPNHLAHLNLHSNRLSVKENYAAILAANQKNGGFGAEIQNQIQNDFQKLKR